MSAALSPNDASEFVPGSQEELQSFLADNFAGSKRALTPVGGRTSLDFGGPLSASAVLISSTRLDRVVDFPARDMTITVEAGMPIDRLAAVLKAEGQQLPIDIAESNRATLGGAMATNTSGPRQFGYGTFRDYVIGVTAMTAEGRVFHSGGRVVKNVAGYDLCKLLVGSVGTLAVITQVTLKLKPLPQSSVLVWASFENLSDRSVAIDGLLTSETRPVAIETLSPLAAALIEGQAGIGLPKDEFLLLVGFEGSERETDWQTGVLRRELQVHRPKELSVVRGAEVDRLWSALTLYPVGSQATLAFQANLLPSKVKLFEERASQLGLATISHSGNGIVIGKLVATAERGPSQNDFLPTLEETARQCGGSIERLHGNPHRQSASAYGVSSSGVLSLMRRLKQAFDPENLLNPGRLFPQSPTQDPTEGRAKPTPNGL